MENIKVSSFKNRLKDLLQEKNMTQKELSNLTGITPSSISDWLRGKYEAKQDKIDIIATALNVSQAYLMGYDVPKVSNIKKITEESSQNLGLTINQEKIFELFNELNEEGQQKAITYTQDLVDSGKYSMLQDLSRTTQAEIDQEVEAYRKELELQARMTKSSQSELTEEEKNKLA